MYCKNCGRELFADAKFCVYCGEPVPEGLLSDSGRKEKKFEFKSDPEFVWNVEGFPTEAQEKTEEVDFSWNTAASEAEKAEEELSFVPSETEEANDAEELLEEIRQEEKNRADARSTAEQKKIDKFYTFNKKNEEFQKLLDKQLERLKLGESTEEREAREAAEAERTAAAEAERDQVREERAEPSESAANAEDAGEREAAAAQAEKPEERAERPEAGEPTAESAKLAESVESEDEDDFIRFDTKELNRDLLEIAMAKAGVKAEGAKPSTDGDTKLAKNGLRSEFKPRFMEEQREKEELSEKKAEEAVRESAPEKKSAAGSLFGDNSEVESLSYGQPATAAEAAEKSDIRAEAQHEAAEAESEARRGEEAAEGSESAGLTENEGGPAVTEEEKPAADTESAEANGEQPYEKSFDWEKKRALDALWGTMELNGNLEEYLHESEINNYVNEKVGKDEGPGSGEDDEEDEYEEEGGGALRIILAIIGILLICEIVLLFARYFIPYSSIGVFATEKLGFATDWFFRLTGI